MVKFFRTAVVSSPLLNLTTIPLLSPLQLRFVVDVLWMPKVEQSTKLSVTESVAASVSNLFPPPMKLEFEEAIYWRFFILSKKRYMAISCGRDGILSDNIEKKGVLLARRDNSKFVRDLYEQIIMKIFDKEGQDNTLYFIINYLNDLWTQIQI